MKVLHINSYYASSSFYKHLFEKQIQKGIDIDVYVPVAKNFINHRIDYGEYTRIVKNHGKYDRYLFHIKHWKILKDVVKQYDVMNYDILHAHSLFSNGYIAYKLNKRLGIQYIVAVRDTDVNIFFEKILPLRKLGIEIMRNAKKIVFLSSTYKDRVIKRYVPSMLHKKILNKSVVIPNGIDPFWLNNKSSHPHVLKKNMINIIYAGRISKRKNVPTTIKACEILLDRGYKVKFTIVGRIEDENEFKKLKGYDFITYISEQPKEKLIELYRTNDIFVMPSITETFGLVYAEAMSQGLPVIYSKGQGFDGQFNEGTVGYSVNCFNAYEIADRIVDIINNYQSLSMNSLRLCNKFDWEKIADVYTKIYT